MCKGTRRGKAMSRLLKDTLSSVAKGDCTAKRRVCRLKALCLSSRRRRGRMSNGGLLAMTQHLPVRLRALRAGVRFGRSGHSTRFVQKRRRARSGCVQRKRLLRGLFSMVHAASSIPPTVRHLHFRKVVRSTRRRRRVQGLAR